MMSRSSSRLVFVGYSQKAGRTSRLNSAVVYFLDLYVAFTLTHAATASAIPVSDPPAGSSDISDNNVTLHPFAKPPTPHPSPYITMAVSTAVLPAVASLHECANFSQTVSPYLHQLSPTHILPLIRGEISPTTWYLSTNPLMSALLFSLAMSVIVFIASEVNKNPSQVDRLWSILPVVYIGHFAAWARMAGMGSERLDTLATFAALWGVSFFLFPFSPQRNWC